MDLSSLKDFNKNVWYRGSKKLSILKITNNSIKFSNGDIINITDEGIFLNKKILTNIPDITVDELMFMYLDYLKNKGYKFI